MRCHFVRIPDAVASVHQIQTEAVFGILEAVRQIDVGKLAGTLGILEMVIKPALEKFRQKSAIYGRHRIFAEQIRSYLIISPCQSLCFKNFTDRFLW